jgi:hypothetical protein
MYIYVYNSIIPAATTMQKCTSNTSHKKKKRGEKTILHPELDIYAKLTHRMTYCISQKAWTLCWKMIFSPAVTSHSYGVLGDLVD